MPERRKRTCPPAAPLSLLAACVSQVVHPAALPGPESGLHRSPAAAVGNPGAPNTHPKPRMHLACSECAKGKACSRPLPCGDHTSSSLYTHAATAPPCFSHLRSCRVGDRGCVKAYTACLGRVGSGPSGGIWWKGSASRPARSCSSSSLAKELRFFFHTTFAVCTAHRRWGGRV